MKSAQFESLMWVAASALKDDHAVPMRTLKATGMVLNVMKQKTK